MNIKNILLVAACSFAVPMTAMTTKEKVVKAAKIAGYSVGIVAPIVNLCTSHEYLQEFFVEKIFKYGLNDTEKALPKYQIDAQEAVDTSAMLTVTLGCLGLSAHGLYTEVKPLVKPLFKKIKQLKNPAAA